MSTSTAVRGDRTEHRSGKRLLRGLVAATVLSLAAVVPLSAPASASLPADGGNGWTLVSTAGPYCHTYTYGTSCHVMYTYFWYDNSFCRSGPRVFLDWRSYYDACYKTYDYWYWR
jgi:hypothetical protein